MEVCAVPLTDFVHGRLNAREGHAVMLPEHTADDLERAGLVRIRGTAVVTKKADEGKAEGDGQGQPSSSLPAAPPSPTKTLSSSKLGENKPRKRGE